MGRANSRKARGMATQALLAKRWRDIGIYPFATDAGPGRSGNDILNTGNLAVEVKAKETLSLVAGVRQARIAALMENAKVEGTGGDPQTIAHERSSDQDFWYAGGGPLPVLVARHNGQGPASIHEWTVTMSLGDFEEVVRQLQFEGHL